MSKPTQTFKSNYFYRLLKKDWNPLTPNIININDDYVEYRRRNWFLISSDSEMFHFQNIIGVDVNKGLFGATIIIKSNGSNDIRAWGFSKKNADTIKLICNHSIKLHTQNGKSELVANAISNANNPSISIADEMKKMKQLLDDGVITQSEFDKHKEKLLR